MSSAFLLAVLYLMLTACTQKPLKDARHFHYNIKFVIACLNYTNITIFAHKVTGIFVALFLVMFQSII